MDILNIVGKNIRKLRKAKGYSQEKLALKAGVNRSYLGYIERGDKNLNLTTLRQISVALNVHPSVMLIDHSDFWDGYLIGSEVASNFSSTTKRGRK
jgi:transcriptional regulator with XRE-family HTH domain